MGDNRREPDLGDEIAGLIVGIIATLFLGWIVGQHRKNELKRLEEQRRLKLPQSLESSGQDPIVYAASASDRLPAQELFLSAGRFLKRQTPNLIRLTSVIVIVVAAILVFVLLGPQSPARGFVVSGLVMFVGGFVAWNVLSPPDHPVVAAGVDNTLVALTDSPTNSEVVDAGEVMPKEPSVHLVQRSYTIKLPKKTDWQPVRAAEFMATLLERFTGLAFQIVATHDQLYWRILDLRCDAEPSALQTVIVSFYPQAEVTWCDDAPTSGDGVFYRHVMHFQHQNDFFQPMKHVEELKQYDPLIALTAEMGALQPGERIVYSLYVADYARFAREQMLNFLVRKVPKNPLRFLTQQGMFQMIAEQGLPPELDLIYPEAETKLYLGKLLSRTYLSFMMVQVDAATRERVLTLAHADGHLRQLDNLPYNGLLAWDKPTEESIAEVASCEQDVATRIEGMIADWVSGQTDKWREHALILDAHELAALWHLPYSEFTASEIAWSKARVFVLMPQGLARMQEGICLGYNGRNERALPVYMPLRNRTTHVAVIGRTGTGKSTLLHNLIHQDIAAGRGVAVIDPHGTLVREVVERSVPLTREDDVVLLDFTQEEYPPPLNPLLLPSGASQLDAAGRMMTLIEHIYRGFEGQMADTLYMTLLTLMHEQTPTLRDVTRLFSSPRYRYELVEHLENPAAEDFWTMFDRLSAGEQEQRRSPVEHRLRAFYGNPALYPVLCHPKMLDFDRLIRERKIVLVSLEAKRAGIPPRDQRLLGAVLIAQIQMAVMGHAAAEAPFHLYVDEAEDFVTTSLPEMLAEARFANLSAGAGEPVSETACR